MNTAAALIAKQSGHSYEIVLPTRKVCRQEWYFTIKAVLWKGDSGEPEGPHIQINMFLCEVLKPDLLGEQQT